MGGPKRPRISIVAALDEKGAIGRENRLPWHIPGDLAHFRRLTTGHPIIMGRETYASIGRALPDRTNIVITSDTGFQAPGCIVVHSLQEALRIAGQVDREEIFVIGGGRVFTQALPLADRLYMTLVEGEFAADTYFPDYSDFNRVVCTQEGASGGHRYRFVVLERE